MKGGFDKLAPFLLAVILSVVVVYATATINLISPIDGFNSTSQTVSFNATVSEDEFLITNVSLYGNFTGAWEANQTNTSGDNDTEYSFSLVLEDGIYIWNIEMCDNETTCSFTAENRTLTIDSQEPQIYNITNETTNETATINWTTNEQANSTITYGTTTELLDGSNSSSSLNTQHTIAIHTLSNGTLYHYNITSCDYYGNCNSTGPYTFTTTNPDITPPQWTHPPVSFTINDSEFLGYQENASDETGIDSFWLNDTSFFSINNTGFLINTTNLTPGSYPLNMSVNDTSNNILSATITITVEDVTFPVWLEEPSDISAYDNESLGIQYNVSDSGGIDSYFIDNTSFFDINQSGFFYNNTNLTLGAYTINISVNDTANNILSKQITITVVDATYPVWNETPSSFQINESIQISIQYNATDNNNIDSYFINDTTAFNITRAGTLYNLTNTLPGNYNLLISVNDTSNNVNSSEITITILDITAPQWNETPSSFSITDTEGVSYKFNATDNVNIDAFSVNNSNFSISSTGLLTNTTTLAPTQYSLNISVNDTSGNSNSSIITITVQDTTAPQWNETPENLTFDNETPIILQYNATDNGNLDIYFINDSTNFTISTTGLLENATLLETGNYYLNISVNDTANNILSAQIKITITYTDNEPPSITINSPANESIQNTSAILLNITPIDNSDIDSCWYNIVGDYNKTNTTISCSNNASSTTTLHIINGTYTIFVYTNDTSGNEISANSSVTVNDSTAPNITATSPSGTLSSSTTSVTLSATTDENATCRYAFANVAYENMTANFTNENITAHTETFSVSDGNSYTIYVRCSDMNGNENNASSTISFSVSEASSSSSGGSSGGGGGSRPTSSSLPAASKATPAGPPKKEIPKPSGQQVIANTTPRLNLTENADLRGAIEKILNLTLDSNQLNAIEELSRETDEATQIVRDFSAADGKTRITTFVHYTGEKEIKDFILLEKIPKDFASTASKITVTAPNGEVTVYEEDPEFIISFKDVSQNDRFFISYEVNQKKSSGILEKINTQIYASNTEATNGDELPQEKAKPLNALLITGLAIIFFAIITVIILKLKSTKKAEPPKQDKRDRTLDIHESEIFKRRR